MVTCNNNRGLRWYGFEGFNPTRQFLEKGSQTCQFLAIKNKTTVIWRLIGAERVLNMGLVKKMEPVNSKSLRSPF